MLEEFKEFVNRGNVVDLAVAVVLGATFGAVVTSFVDDILMQVIAAIFGQPDFSSLTIHWGDQVGVDDNGLPLYEQQIFYGSFLNAVISFILVAFGVFLVVKAINAARRPKEADPVALTEVELLTEIRDALRTRA